MSTPTEPTAPAVEPTQPVALPEADLTVAPTSAAADDAALPAEAEAADLAAVVDADAVEADADTAVADAAAPAEAGAAAAAPAAVAGMSPSACARELKKRFPALFGDRALPIKLRIQADIQERAPGVFTKKALSIFLHRHTGSTPYLIALSKAQTRFDLDGQPAGELLEEHRAAAAEELKRRRALNEERRAVEDEQRHNRANLLRDFERTTLTRANFCALKGVADEALDGLLEIARQEAAEWAARRPAEPRRDDRGPRGPRRDERGARGPGPGGQRSPCG